MIIVLSLLFMSISIPAAALEPVSAASTNINSTMTNSEIQNVLDNAASGDTINFLGQLYTNIQLAINKTLNIVTHVGTVLSGPSSSGSAVFLINGSKASGTQISGFNITGSGSGILVNSTSNVNISKCNISASDGSAVIINKSSGTNIKNSNITNSITGISISNSEKTKITGITVKNNKKDGVDVKNSASTTINHTKITGNAERGVKISNSNSTVVNGSTLTGNGNKAGESSDEGAVYVKNSRSVKITYNTINDNSQGVTVTDSDNVAITNNTINNNYGEGILLNGTLLENISVKGNDIEKNGNGIVLNYHMGINIHINGNIVTASAYNSLQDGEDSGIGIRFGSGYASNSGTEVIEHNAIFDNNVMDMRGRDAQVLPNVGSNWYGYSPLLCGCVKYAQAMYLQGIQIGTNTYAGGFYDGVTGQLAADFPSLLVKLSGNGFSLSAMSQNGQAIFHLDPNLGSGRLTLTATRVNAYGNWIKDNPQHSTNGTDPNSNPGKGNGNSSGTGNGGANGGNGDDSSSGATSGPSSSVGQANTASAAAGSAGSSGQSGSATKKTAQELFIDNTVKNPTVWSIIGIIVLLVLIFGVYYRNELMSMIKKSKK